MSALTSALQYYSGLIGSGLIGIFADGTPWSMGRVIAAAGIGSLLSTLLLWPARIVEKRR